MPHDPLARIELKLDHVIQQNKWVIEQNWHILDAIMQFGQNDPRIAGLLVDVQKRTAELKAAVAAAPINTPQ